VTEIADIERVARQALREVGEAIGGYRRPVLAAELDAARDLLAAAGIAAEIDPAPAALPPAIDAVLAWTVREGVTNVIRHSGAQRCQIRLHAEGETVRAEVSDDGGGTAARPATTGGRGLTGLGERISIVGGQLSTGAARDGGFRLVVTVPLPVGSSAVGNAGEAIGVAPR
jgi:two-component system sensor histidine kinase DesK